jgi:hypothetical protein
MSACVQCVPLLVRVDMGVQTDDGGPDCVPLHMVPWVVSRGFVRTPRKHFVGAAVRVHKGKDGRVHQVVWPRHYYFAGSRTEGSCSAARSSIKS